MSRARLEPGQDLPGWAGFSRRGLLAFGVFALGTFGLGLGLAAFSGDLFGHASYGADTYSRSLVGHRALAELLRRTGLGVVQGRTPGETRARARFPLLSLEPELSDPPEPGSPGSRALVDLDRERRATALYAQALGAGAPVVLALPKRSVRPSPDIGGWIASEELLPDEAAMRPLARLRAALLAAPPAEAEDAGEEGGATAPQRSAEPAPGAEPPRIVRVQESGACRAAPLGLAEARVQPDGPLQLLRPERGLEPMAECEAGVLIGRLARRDGPPVVVVSDPDLLNNRGLARGDHAALVRALLDTLDAAGVVFDETLHGHVSGQGVLARALSFPLGLVSAHAALAFLLFGLCVSARFGRPRPAPPALPPGKALLIENTAELLRAHSDHRAALGRYLEGVLQELGRRYGGRGTGPSPERTLLERLGALGRARGVQEDPAELVRAAHAPGLRAPEALRLARRVHAWRAALLDTKRPHLHGRRR